MALATLLAFGFFGAERLAAQQQEQAAPRPGNFDPEQMRQRRMERLREQFDVTDEAEWKLIQERIEKVDTARREVATSTFFMGGGRRGGGAGAGGGPGGGFGGFRGETNVELEALQKALDAKASADEIKTKLARLRDSRKEKEEKLEKAQEELKKILSVRQEAIAVVNGLLK